MNQWNLAGAEWSGVTEEMIKVAFQSAEEYISEQLKKGSLSEKELPPLYMSIKDFPPSCPYNIANIHYPEKTTFEVTIDDRIDQLQELDQAKGIPKAVILTALSVEFKAVSAHLTNLQEETHTQGTVYERGRFSSADRSWEVVIVEIGQGNPAAAMEAERAIQQFKPNVVLFVGVAGGIKDVQLGDVVAATKVYGYESGKDKAYFEPRPEVGYSTYPMVQRARAEARKDSWLQRIGRPYSDSPSAPHAFVGPIAAGAKVVASIKSNTYSLLRKQYSDALAVEMEGYGFLTAARANPGVEALVVRGISDLITDKSQTDAEGWQEIAAQNASAFAFEVLANISIPLESSTGDRENLPQLSFSEDIDFSPPTLADKQVGAKRSWFIRLRVTNTGKTVATNCFGKLVMVLNKKGEHLKQFDTLKLYWTRQDKPDNFQPLDIRESSDFTYLDIAQVKEAENALALRVVIPDRHRLVRPLGHIGKPECLLPGTYYVQIAVYADNASIEPTWFEIEWKDDYLIEPYPCNIKKVEAPSVSRQ
jgi:nucleoside phosphorylase